MKREIYTQLQRMGYQSVFLNEENYENLWNSAVGKVGGLYDSKTGNFKPQAYVEAMKILAVNIASEVEYSVLIVPNFVVKRAKVSGKFVSWDGVYRDYLMKNQTYNSYSFHGETKGLSLELRAFSSDGAWLFNSYGGVSLPYEVNMEEAKHEMRDKLFESREEIEEGVRLALSALRPREQ